MTRTTKIVLAILILGILALLGWGVYYWFFTPRGGTGTQPGQRSFLFFPSGEMPPTTDNQNNNGEPIIPELTQNGDLVKIVSDPVIGATLTKDETKLLYYKRSGGNLFRSDPDGKNEETVLNLTVVGLTDVNWSADRAYAILSFIENGAVKRFIENVATSSTLFLPSSITSVDWSPTDPKVIAYTERKAPGISVTTASSALKNLRVVFANTIPDYILQWQNKSSLLLVTPPSFAAPSLALSVALTGKATELPAGRGLAILPNPLGTVLAVSGVDNGKPLPLRLINQKGETVGTADVATLTEKCAWAADGSAIYCAIPINPDGRLPDDWYKGLVSFSDRIVKIDSRTGAVTDILARSTFDAVNLFADSKNQFLFFTNKTDSSLWRIKLK